MGWILCKDKLPLDRCADLILADKYGDVHTDAFYDTKEKRFVMRCHDDYEWWWHTCDEDDGIIAWMQLPKFHLGDYVND